MRTFGRLPRSSPVACDWFSRRLIQISGALPPSLANVNICIAHIDGAEIALARDKMNYPVGWQRDASLTALPGNFCIDCRTEINETIDKFFKCGHPLHILARKVRLICESDHHATMCPHNIEVQFKFEDFKRVLSALTESGAHRPRIDQELGLWAQRMIHQDPSMVLRALREFPVTRKAIASVVKELVESVTSQNVVPIGVSFFLVERFMLKLDVITDAYLARSRHVVGPASPWPAPYDAAAYASMKTWLLYLEGKLCFRELCKVCKRRVKTVVLCLGYESYSSLPVLPLEIIGNIFFALEL